MNGMKMLTKRILTAILGPTATDRIATLYEDKKTQIEYRLNPIGCRSAQRLRTFKDRYWGKRCFIIGNGPSLNAMDLSPLRNEYTFGLNRIYLLFDRLGFPTTFFVSVNRYVIDQCADDIEKLPCIKFIGWRARHFIRPKDDVIFLRSVRDPCFSTDPVTQGVWEGATVTYVAMQLAFYFGFHQVILIGVDHSFQTNGPPHQLVTSTGDDPNHFDPSYFGKGFRWQLPDLGMSEVAYQMARNQFEGAGREILDATVGGKLKIFPKKNYHSLFYTHY